MNPFRTSSGSKDPDTTELPTSTTADHPGRPGCTNCPSILIESFKTKLVGPGWKAYRITINGLDCTSLPDQEILQPRDSSEVQVSSSTTYDTIDKIKKIYFKARAFRSVQFTFKKEGETGGEVLLSFDADRVVIFHAGESDMLHSK